MRSFSEDRKRLEQGSISFEDLVKEYLSSIEEQSDLNSYVTIYADSALKKACLLDEKKARGEQLGKCAGMFVALKDNMSVKGYPLSCGSHILNKHEAIYDAFVVEELLKEDAIILGHTNMDEFAMGSSNENSFYGAVKNPHDKSRVSGGSSGGSAVAVSSGMANIAFGSDTGGSIRQPAAFTGSYGFKGSYGRVSRRGLVAFSSSLDQIGPFTNSTEDLAAVLNVIMKHDPLDSTSISCEEEDFNSYLNKAVDTIKIGIAPEFFTAGLNDEIRQKVDELKEKLSAHNVEFVDIRLPHIKHSIAVYYIIATAEASSNLSRYDGIRYGLREITETSDLHEMYAQTRSAGFGEEVKRRIMLGTFVLSHGYFDAYYRKAQKVRRLIKNDFDKAFQSCDIILSPTTPTTAFKMGEFKDDPLALYLADIYTAPVNLAGNTAISIPYGKDKDGLPIGLQLIGDRFQEGKLLQLSHFIETNLTEEIS